MSIGGSGEHDRRLDVVAVAAKLLAQAQELSRRGVQVLEIDGFALDGRAMTALESPDCTQLSDLGLGLVHPLRRHQSLLGFLEVFRDQVRLCPGDSEPEPVGVGDGLDVLKPLQRLRR